MQALPPPQLPRPTPTPTAGADDPWRVVSSKPLPAAGDDPWREVTPSPTPTATPTMPALGGPPPTIDLGEVARGVRNRALTFARATAPTVGSVIGGTLGARGGFMGAIEGATAGAGAGTLASAAVETMAGAPPSLPDLEKRIGADMLAGGTMELGGAGLTSAVAKAWHAVTPARTIARVAREGMTAEGKEAAQYMAGHVLPSQVSDSPLIKFFGNIMAGSPMTQAQTAAFLKDQRARFITKAEGIIAKPGERATAEGAGQVIKDAKIADAAKVQADMAATIERRYQQALAESQASVGEVQGLFGPASGRQAFGTRTQELLTEAHDAARKEASDMYNAVWGQTKGMGLDPEPLLAKARELRGEAGVVPGATGVAGRANRAEGVLLSKEDAAREAVEAARAQAQDLAGRSQVESLIARMDPADPRRQALLNDLAEMEHTLMGGVSEADGKFTLTPQQTHLLRSYYGRMGFAEGDRSLEKGTFKQLWAAADATLQQMPENLYAQYTHANQLHADMIRTYEEGALETIAKKAPQELLTTLRGMIRSGDLEGLSTFQRVVGEEGTKAMRAEVWRSLTTTPGGTPVTPKQLLNRLDSLDVDGLKTFFGDASGAIGDAKSLWQTAAAAKPAKAGASLDAMHAMPVRDLVAQSLRHADTDQIAKLRALVGQDGWKQVQSVDLQDLFGRTGSTGAADPNLITAAKLRSTLEAYGEQAFVAAHDQATWNSIQVFLRAWDKVTRQEGINTGKMAIQLATPAAIGAMAGAGVGVLTGHLPEATTVGGAAGVILGPKLLARIFTSPRMREELLKGALARAKGDTPFLLRSTLQLFGMLAAEGLVQKGPDGSYQTPDTPPAGRGAGPGVSPNIGQGGRAGGPPSITATPTPAVPSAPPSVPGSGAVRALETLSDVGLLPSGIVRPTPPPAVAEETAAGTVPPRFTSGGRPASSTTFRATPPPPVTSPAPTTPKQALDPHIQQAAAKHGVDPRLVQAVVRQESNFNPSAVSPKGAQGAMQLMPKTSRGLNVADPFQADQNIDAGTGELARLLKHYGGNLDHALAAYNWGQGHVDAWLKSNPTNLQGLPVETREYIRRIRQEYDAQSPR